MDNRFPQAVITNFHNRARGENTSIVITTTTGRQNKRTKHTINYAEFEENFFDDETDGNYVEEGYGAYGSRNGGNNNYNHNNQNNSNQANVARLATKTKHMNFTDEELMANSSTGDILIPLKIEIDSDPYKVVDYMMWNMNETLITPEQFALITCQDLDLPNSFQQLIASSIKTQIEEYTTLSAVQIPSNIDLHVIIDLSCNLHNQLYEDKFEWDLTDETVTPEIFAKYVVMDLGLPLEFLPAIAHSLHEAILRSKKDFLEGRLPQELDNKSAFGYQGGIRLDQDTLGIDWSPTVEVLSQEEIQKRQVEKIRNSRRLKRSTMKNEDTKKRPYKKRNTGNFDLH